MNNRGIVAKRYAKALFDAARGNDRVRQVEEELALLVGAMKDNADFRSLFEHPNMDRGAKVKLVRDVFGNNLSELVYNTIELMVKKRRETILPALLQGYQDAANESAGQARAVIYTPYTLDEAQQARLVQQFEQLTGRTLAGENVLKPELLGGFQVKIGDRLYDASMSGKLGRLNKSLKQAQSL